MFVGGALVCSDAVEWPNRFDRRSRKSAQSLLFDLAPIIRDAKCPATMVLNHFHDLQETFLGADVNRPLRIPSL